MQYNRPSGGKGKFMVVLLLLVVIGTVFYIFYKSGKIQLPSFPTLKPVAQQITSDTTMLVSNENIVIPTVDWCKIQNTQVGTTREDPITDKIIGWDSVQNCCVREVYGFDCALQNNVTTRYCYTANIGGVVKYVAINNYFANVENYKTFISNLDKYYIQNKPCNASIYPTLVRGV